MSQCAAVRTQRFESSTPLQRYFASGEKSATMKEAVGSSESSPPTMRSSGVRGCFGSTTGHDCGGAVGSMESLSTFGEISGWAEEKEIIKRKRGRRRIWIWIMLKDAGPRGREKFGRTNAVGA